MSTDKTSPLNLRSAISLACTELVGNAPRKEWYELYLDAVHAISSVLKGGITYWEFTVKVPTQVDTMLTEVINRLENGAIKPRASRRPATGV